MCSGARIYRSKVAPAVLVCELATVRAARVGALLPEPHPVLRPNDGANLLIRDAYSEGEEDWIHLLNKEVGVHLVTRDISIGVIQEANVLIICLAPLWITCEDPRKEARAGCRPVEVIVNRRPDLFLWRARVHLGRSTKKGQHLIVMRGCKKISE